MSKTVYSLRAKFYRHFSLLLLLLDILAVAPLVLYVPLLFQILYLLVSSIAWLICYMGNYFLFHAYVKDNAGKFPGALPPKKGAFDIRNGSCNSAQTFALLSSAVEDEEFKIVKSTYYLVMLCSIAHLLATLYIVSSMHK